MPRPISHLRVVVEFCDALLLALSITLLVAKVLPGGTVTFGTVFTGVGSLAIRVGVTKLLNASERF